MVGSSTAITVEGLIKHYKKSKALDGLDFTIPSGFLVGRDYQTLSDRF